MGVDETTHGYYASILSQVATGVFVIEPRIAGDLTTLDVSMVNEMGAKFFGRHGAVGDDILREACN